MLFSGVIFVAFVLDANLLVFIPGYKEEPLMNFTDASPLNINYISFSTYDYIPASWFYDCQFDGFADELEDDVRPKTPHQLLLQNISAKAENASFPPDLESINFSFNIASIRYQQDHGFLQTRLTLVLVSAGRLQYMEWHLDEREGERVLENFSIFGEII